MILAFLAPLAARALGWLRGPAGGAVAVTGIAVVLVGAIALGLAWLRGDAARDARAVCDTRQIETRLAQETARREAIEASMRQANAERNRQALELDMARGRIREMEQEEEGRRAEANRKDAQAGRNGVVFRADDPWLQPRAGAGARTDDARGRSGSGPLP